MKIAVIGSGVIGLTSAVVALEEGHHVTIYTDKPAGETTSARSGASFKPFSVAWNGLTAAMCKRSWIGFDRLTRYGDPEKTGVRLHDHWEASSTPMKLRPFHSLLPGGVELHEAPNVPGGHRYGIKYQTFFIDTSLFLPYLRGRVHDLGGRIVVREKFRNVAELAELPAEVVINCTGLGARELVGDTAMHALKGQIAVIGPHPEIDYSISADGFYIYPRYNDTVLGGTTELDVESETADGGAVQLLVSGNKGVLPSLTLDQVTKSYGGLRPYREGGPRLEAEPLGNRQLVHNYGHGGAGVTLSWGSAHMALDLIAAPAPMVY
ncbi:MAG TPA: FAD-dependent oxidoreductase [Candidatus Saccharimonadia bacterium]|jgi:D-amino-acid oxidase|nr:FAD-dependent oxidoreductase [Candidatus Saccharimonadia bacterium]